ncbi:MAG: GNAT family N-acetyltransferase [Planctomycetota bacterium]
MAIRKISGLFRIRRREVFVCGRLEELHEKRPKIPITIQDASYDNVHRVTDFRNEKVEESFRRFLYQGQIGVYAISDSKAVGHAWAIICPKKRQMANGYFQLHKREALIHFCNTEPSCRGQGIYQAMLFALCKRLLEEAKVKSVFIDTDLGNMPSVRGIQKVGFKPVGRYFYFLFRNTLIYKRNISK